MTPLNAREWLEAQHLAGNPFALELLELLGAESYYQECVNMVIDLRDKAPKEIRESPDLWRLVEWFGDREALLAEVEEVTAVHSEGVDWPDGTKPGDVADQLRAMFMSPRWLEYDL